jgi:hypothetical protein
MKMFDINFSYVEPRWGDAQIPAETEQEARDEFDLYIKEFYPEAEELEIMNIQEEKDDDVTIS